jgi:hypothetical protein
VPSKVPPRTSGSKGLGIRNGLSRCRAAERRPGGFFEHDQNCGAGVRVLPRTERQVFNSIKEAERKAALRQIYLARVNQLFSVTTVPDGVERKCGKGLRFAASR